MARGLSNVDINSDSWEIMILKLNEVLRSHTLEILTANTTYANTGNTTVQRTAQLYGTFGSNNVVVSSTLRGGNVTGQHANLVVSSNVNIVNTAAANVNLLIGNSSVVSYMNPIGSYIGNTVANSFMNTTSIVIQSNSTVNTTITASTLRIANSSSSANIDSISFATGITVANTTAVGVGANVIANSTSFRVSSAVSNAVINASTLAVGNSTVSTVANTSTLRITDGARASELNSNGFVFDSIYKVDTLSNNNIGTNISTPLMIYTFPRASISSGKFQVQVKNGNTTQISEMLLAHDNTTAYVSTYGTIASPIIVGNTSPLGTFSAAINGANVELMLSQTVVNSAIKVVANLIT